MLFVRSLCRLRPNAPSHTFFTSSAQSLRYHPPQYQQRRRGFLDVLDRIPQNGVFYGIMGLNGLVFAMWYMSEQKYRYERDPKSYQWMYSNFTSSLRNLAQGRYWTVLTSTFSHNEWSHILFNGFTYFFTAPVVLQLLGSKKFLTLYIGSGIASSVTSLIYCRFVDKQDRASHGASGSIYSVVTFLACAAPTATFQLYGIIPVPAWLLVSGLVGYDVYKTYSDSRGQVDTLGHIGGAVAGAAYYLLIRRRPF